MKKRPLSIGVIAWFLMVQATVFIWNDLRVLTDPDARTIMGITELPVPIWAVRFLAPSLVALACGLGLWMGQNWARFVYVGWFFGHLIIHVPVLSKIQPIVEGTLYLVVMAFLLFRPTANAYFAGPAADEGGASSPDAAGRAVRHGLAALAVAIFCAMAFVKAKPFVKLELLNGVGACVAAALCAELALSRFRQWRRDLGRILLSGLGLTALGFFLLAALFLLEGLRVCVAPGMVTMLSDRLIGNAVLLGVAAAGWLLMQSDAGSEGES